MKRINTQNINTPELVDNIFQIKWDKKLHDKDQNRFDELAAKFEGGKYLDLGCFNSPKPVELAENSDNEVWAVDHAPEVIKTLKSKFPKVNYLCKDFHKLPFKPNYFDYIVIGEVIEHLEEPQKIIDEAYDLLKEGGILTISTPFEETITQPLISAEHVWGYEEDDIKTLLQNSGFKDIEIQINRDNVPVFIAYAKK